jgi:hypothetical protein
MASDQVLSGGAVALVAFAVAWARDEYVRHRQRRQKDRAVLAAIAEEVAANLRIAENNRNLIRHDLGLLDQGRSLVNPLDPLELGFWELVKLDPPRGLLLDASALAAVRKVARLTGQVNQMLHSRRRIAWQACRWMAP